MKLSLSNNIFYFIRVFRKHYFVSTKREKESLFLLLSKILLLQFSVSWNKNIEQTVNITKISKIQYFKIEKCLAILVRLQLGTEVNCALLYSVRIRVRLSAVNNFWYEPLNSKPLRRFSSLSRAKSNRSWVCVRNRGARVSRALFRLTATISASTKYSLCLLMVAYRYP